MLAQCNGISNGERGTSEESEYCFGSQRQEQTVWRHFAGNDSVILVAVPIHSPNYRRKNPNHFKTISISIMRSAVTARLSEGTGVHGNSAAATTQGVFNERSHFILKSGLLFFTVFNIHFLRKERERFYGTA